MKYYRAKNDVDRRNNLISFRASTEDRLRAEELAQAMKVSSTSALFRALLNEKADELGINAPELVS